MTKAESKYFNTALRMDEAMMELLQEKEFEYITIKELCGRAGVNRSTFYLHYDNTRQLLEECVELLQQRFNAYFAREEGDFLSRLPRCDREELLLITPEYLTPYLTFVREHRRLYRAALDHPADFQAQDTYHKLFSQIFDPILARFRVPEEERKSIMAFYLAGIEAIVAEWMRADCRQPISFVIGVILRCIPS